MQGEQRAALVYDLVGDAAIGEALGMRIGLEQRRSTSAMDGVDPVNGNGAPKAASVASTPTASASRSIAIALASKAPNEKPGALATTGSQCENTPPERVCASGEKEARSRCYALTVRKKPLTVAQPAR